MKYSFFRHTKAGELLFAEIDLFRRPQSTDVSCPFRICQDKLLSIKRVMLQICSNIISEFSINKDHTL